MIDVDAPRRRGARARATTRTRMTQQEMREILRDAMLKKAREGVPAPERHPARTRCGRTSRRTGPTSTTPSGAASRPSSSRRRPPPPTVLRRRAQGRARRSGGSSCAASRSTRAPRPTCPLDLAGDFGFVSPPGDPRGANPTHPRRGARGGLRPSTTSATSSPRVVPAGGKYYVVKLTSKTDPHERTFEEAERQHPREARAGQDPRARKTRSSTSSASSTP